MAIKVRSLNYYLKEIESSDITNIHKGLSNPEITKIMTSTIPL